MIKIWDKEIKDTTKVNWTIAGNEVTFWYDYGNDAERLETIPLNEIIDEYVDHEIDRCGLLD